MPMKAKRKPVSIHQQLLKRGFRLEKVVQRHIGVPSQVKRFSEQVEYGEIDRFAVIPGYLVPQTKPQKLSRQYYDANSFVIYVKPYE